MSSGEDPAEREANAMLNCVMQALLWRRVVVDFGHELVTAIHTPLVWSNERPNRDEYMAAFNHTTLSAAKVKRKDSQTDELIMLPSSPIRRPIQCC